MRHTFAVMMGNNNKSLIFSLRNSITADNIFKFKNILESKQINVNESLVSSKIKKKKKYDKNKL